MRWSHARVLGSIWAETTKARCQLQRPNTLAADYRSNVRSISGCTIGDVAWGSVVRYALREDRRTTAARQAGRALAGRFRERAVEASHRSPRKSPSLQQPTARPDRSEWANYRHRLVSKSRHGSRNALHHDDARERGAEHFQARVPIAVSVRRSHRKAANIGPHRSAMAERVLSLRGA